MSILKTKLGKDKLFVMKLNYKKSGDFYVVNVHKDIFRREHVNELKITVNRIIAEDGRVIIIDLSELDGIDGVGFGVFLTIQKMALIHNVKIKLIGLKPYVEQVFKQTHLNRVLDLDDQDEPAVKVKEIYAENALVA